MISSLGLPTRAPLVSHFMMGLEKTKAQKGEVSRSARALEKDMLLALYKICVSNPALTPEARAAGTLRYVSA